MNIRACAVVAVLLLIACSPSIFAAEPLHQRATPTPLPYSTASATQTQHFEDSVSLSDTIRAPDFALDLPGGLRSYLGVSRTAPSVADNNLLNLYLLLVGSRLSR